MWETALQLAGYREDSLIETRKLRYTGSVVRSAEPFSFVPPVVFTVSVLCNDGVPNWSPWLSDQLCCARSGSGELPGERGGSPGSFRPLYSLSRVDALQSGVSAIQGQQVPRIRSW